MTSLKQKQESARTTFEKLLTEYQLTRMEIDLLFSIQGLILERLIKDGKISPK